MSVHTMRQTEAEPVSYPAVSGLSDEALALNQAALWQRIEAYTAWRFTPREVVWTVGGEAGQQWFPPLAPISDATGELWSDYDWQPQDLLQGPLGIIIPSFGIWRITATVGDGIALPEAVAEAFRRFAGYLAADDSGVPGASRVSESLGDASESISRNPAWIARALDNSGAADLLRPYRRA